MTLTFESKTIFRRKFPDMGLHKVVVTTVHVPDTETLVELRDDPFTHGKMRLMNYPSHKEGWVGGVRVVPPCTLYQDDDGIFGLIVRSETDLQF